jgi:lipopolysaccharide transport system ATP-binding protein
MSDTLIRVENVSKKFCRSLKKSLWYGMQDLGREVTGRCHDRLGVLRSDEFWAIDNLSFEVRRGECLGLIGPNGAGKSTLLRMLNGLIRPDSGRITMQGNVGALIALGAGFNPMLTGRENVFAVGAILGLKKNEIISKYRSIVEFSELEQFMDTPVQSYSSGMQVRLGFSVYAELSPDILLIDEVLAVGDFQFKIKCLSRIGELMDRAAVIFVSHQIEMISHLCHLCLLLTYGKKNYFGDTQEAISLYREQTSTNRPINWMQTIDWIHEVQLVQSHKYIDKSTIFSLTVHFISNRALTICEARVHFVDIEGNIVAEWRSSLHEQDCNITTGTNKLDLTIGSLPFSNGRYTLRFNLQPEVSAQYLISANDFTDIIVANSINSRARVLL